MQNKVTVWITAINYVKNIIKNRFVRLVFLQEAVITKIKYLAVATETLKISANWIFPPFFSRLAATKALYTYIYILTNSYGMSDKVLKQYIQKSPEEIRANIKTYL